MTLGTYAGLLRNNRNFRLVWISQIVSEIGDWFYSVAVLSFVIQVTGSAKSMAFAFAMQVLPQVISSPFAGVINDRVSRRSIMIFADWARAAIVAAMLLVRGPETMWLLYVLLFLETVMWALFEPARTAAIPNMTEGEETAVANALSSATWAIAFAAGSGIGGVVQAYFGRQAVFAIDSLSFILSAILISRTKFHEPHAEGQPPLSWRDFVNFSPVAEGFRYAMRDTERLRTMLVKTGLALLGVNWVVLPLLGEREFAFRLPGVSAADAGTLGMSFLLSARGFGALIGAIGGARYAGTSASRLRRGIGIGFCLGALGYVCLSAAPNIVVGMLCCVVAHAGGSISWTGSTTLLQRITEDKYRGRVFSSEYALCMAVLAAVTYLAGSAVDAGWSVRTVCLTAGVASLGPAVLWLAWGTGRGAESTGPEV